MNKPKILIITPHSKCKETVRDCDLRARDVALNMEKVAKNAMYDVVLFESDVERKIHDYNRIESFNTPWREKIRNYIESNLDNEIIIFEMHSFPAKDTEFTEGSQIALLAIDEYYYKTKILHDYLVSEGIKINTAINNTRIVNLMVDTSRYPNIKQHYLIEFNEDKSVLNVSDENKILKKIFLLSIGNHINLISVILPIILFIMLFILYIMVYRTDFHSVDQEIL